MARIFTINFQFRGADHAAIVSTYKEKTGCDCYQATLFDEALSHLVPDGVIRFCTGDDKSTQTDTAQLELVQTLQKAVTRHLQTLTI